MPTPGYIYILINPAMPKLLKIGKTTKPPESRAAELSAVTGMPTPFWVAFEVYVADCDEGEAQAHAQLRAFRITGDREFFAAPPKTAMAVLSKIAEEMPYVEKIEPEISEAERQRLKVQADFTALQNAAFKGDPKSQRLISSAYQAGEGVLRDLSKAQAWLQIAAANGHCGAQIELAEQHETGGKIIESLAFYTLACRSGLTAAIEARKRLSLKITREEVEMVRRRVSEILAQKERLLANLTTQPFGKS